MSKVDKVLDRLVTRIGKSTKSAVYQTLINWSSKTTQLIRSELPRWVDKSLVSFSVERRGRSLISRIVGRKKTYIVQILPVNRKALSFIPRKGTYPSYPYWWKGYVVYKRVIQIRTTKYPVQKILERFRRELGNLQRLLSHLIGRYLKAIGDVKTTIP